MAWLCSMQVATRTAQFQALGRAISEQNQLKLIIVYNILACTMVCRILVYFGRCPCSVYQARVQGLILIGVCVCVFSVFSCVVAFDITGISCALLQPLCTCIDSTWCIPSKPSTEWYVQLSIVLCTIKP